MADAHATRAYRVETKRHQDRAQRAINDLRQQVSQLTADPASLSRALNAATGVGMVIEALAALKTATDLAFLADEEG